MKEDFMGCYVYDQLLYNEKFNGRNIELMEYSSYGIFHKSCDLFWLWENNL